MAGHLTGKGTESTIGNAPLRDCPGHVLGWARRGRLGETRGDLSGEFVIHDCLMRKTICCKRNVTDDPYLREKKGTRSQTSPWTHESGVEGTISKTGGLK